MAEDESEKILKEYFSKNNILIIDPISSGRTNIASCISKFGAQRHKMALVGSLNEAREALKKEKPKVIFAEFMVGKESSLDLIQIQKSLFEQEKIKDSFFVLVTSNASQSAVARAAEEDVDTFIIKPFSLDSMKKALETSVKLKLFPNLYLRLVDEGKEYLFRGEFQKAIECFQKAIPESKTPTLALFYYGQAEFMQQALTSAEGKYTEGLSFNKIHYKCLVGLFDLLNNEKRYADAYDVMRRLAQFFPANPKRLAQVLRLSVLTNNFQDVESYYRIFVEIEERNDELIRYMCSALAVTGRYYLRQKVYPRAIEVFENAAISAAGRVGFMFYIIEALVEYGMFKESEPFLSRMQNLAPGSKEVIAAQFLTLDSSVNVRDVVHRGRGVLKDGVEFPAVYEKLINCSIQAGYRDSALELANDARKKWPERSKYFLQGFTAEELKSIGASN